MPDPVDPPSLRDAISVDEIRRWMGLYRSASGTSPVIDDDDGWERHLWTGVGLRPSDFARPRLTYTEEPPEETSLAMPLLAPADTLHAVQASHLEWRQRPLAAAGREEYLTNISSINPQRAVVACGQSVYNANWNHCNELWLVGQAGSDPFDELTEELPNADEVPLISVATSDQMDHMGRTVRRHYVVFDTAAPAFLATAGDRFAYPPMGNGGGRGVAFPVVVHNAHFTSMMMLEMSLRRMNSSDALPQTLPMGSSMRLMEFGGVMRSGLQASVDEWLFNRYF